MTVTTALAFSLSVALLLGGARVLGATAVRAGQPAVVGEILAGIAAGQVFLPILPATVAPLISGLATIGLALFMFIVGCELDPGLLQGRRRTVLGVAAGSVLVPLLGGTLAALLLAPRYALRSHLGFVLFIGIAMSVTALPVLARIVADRGLAGKPLGAVALAGAAVGDVAAWLGLAAVAAFSGTANQWRGSFLPVYLLALIAVVRPLLSRLLKISDDRRAPTPMLSGLLVAGLLLSCITTEWLGVHYIFGALAFGAAMPRGTGQRRFGGRLLAGPGRAATLLVPLYFVVAGSKLHLTGFGGSDWPTLLVIIGVAVMTKAVGGYGGARLTGLPHGVALPLSVLLNVRGLTEIVMLSVGLELHLIDSRIYSMMVVMAVVTTAMAGPMLRATLGSARVDDERPDRRGHPRQRSQWPWRSPGRSVLSGERGEAHARR